MQETLNICTWGICIGYMDQQLKQKQAINKSLRLNAEKDIKERTLVQIENYDLLTITCKAMSLASIAHTWQDKYSTTSCMSNALMMEKNKV